MKRLKLKILSAILISMLLTVSFSLMVQARPWIPPPDTTYSYSHSLKVTAYRSPEPMILIPEFWLSVELDVTSNTQDITSYSGSWQFWGDRDWIIWPIWYVEWRIGGVTTVYTFNYIDYGYGLRFLDSVRYSVTGRIVESDGSPHAWWEIWVQIDTSGVATEGFSVWDDGINYIYLSL